MKQRTQELTKYNLWNTAFKRFTSNFLKIKNLFQIFWRLYSTNFTGPILECFVSNIDNGFEKRRGWTTECSRLLYYEIQINLTQFPFTASETGLNYRNWIYEPQMSSDDLRHLILAN